MEDEDEYAGVEDKKYTGRTPLALGLQELGFCISIILQFFFISLRIPEVVISIIKIISKFKVFYLLSFISFAMICIISFFNLYFEKHDQKKFFIIIYRVIFFCLFILDGISYFFYYYEEINNTVIFIFLLLSDTFNIALFTCYICCILK